jgi:hypothetical protein
MLATEAPPALQVEGATCSPWLCPSPRQPSLDLDERLARELSELHRVQKEGRGMLTEAEYMAQIGAMQARAGSIAHDFSDRR